MNEPKRVTVKDVIRWHRHSGKAIKAGFAGDDTGIDAYRKQVLSRFRARNKKTASKSSTSPFAQFTRPDSCLDSLSGTDPLTAVGAMIAARNAQLRYNQEQSDLYSALLGGAAGIFGKLI